MTPAILLFALLACRTPDKPDDTQPSTDDTGPVPVDADGDGFSADEDCDDSDAAIHPGADEACDGVDNDCDDEVDEGLLGTWYADADADGWGNIDAPSQACEQPPGTVDGPRATDCDDDNAEVHPEAAERCDGLDNDCDELIDEDLQELWYADADGDGFGSAERTLESCDPGDGWVASAGDCDDSSSRVHPHAPELCNDADDDCDGFVDEELEATWYQDADGDAYGDPTTTTFDCEPAAGWVEDGTDCDDANSDIHPGADERCNGYDDDCDALTDDQDSPVADLATWYLDADADGYGDDSATTQACDQPSGASALAGDCDDADPAINPGASEEDCTDPTDYNCDGSTGYADLDGDGWAACEDCDDTDAAINLDGVERCDGADNDCDGDVDEDDAVDVATWYADADGDAYGDPLTTTQACDQPRGYVSIAYATDCDDADAGVHPAGAEDCDGVDDDCDGDVDEGVTDTFWADRDGDGYGDASDATEACTAPSGYVPDGAAATEDCDDGAATVNPGATEVCNETDDDCDGAVDEPDAADAATWFRDGDRDGYGDAAATTVACDQPSGYASDASDCDDGDDDIHPGADEHCDGADEDCDGDVDDNPVDADTWYGDADGDGYGDAGDSVQACSQPSGSVADSSDCDDGDAATNPGASEICNGEDDDCDGLTDDDDAGVLGGSAWYADADNDGYGSSAYSTVACDQPSGWVADSSDCDDTDDDAWPGNDERCDGADNDCDGDVDEADAIDSGTWYTDADADGYGSAGTATRACDQPSGSVPDGTDCDDSDAGSNPGAAELCDGVDNDCDGAVDDDPTDGDTWYDDLDGDGYGDASSAQVTCSQPSGTVSDSADCHDDDPTAYPGSTTTEVPFDGVDQDCDGNDLCTDLNCDGRPDLLFPSYRSDSTWSTNSRAFFGTGYGFAASYGVTLEGVGPLSALVEDLDDDGYLDIALGGYYDGTTRLVDSYVYWGSAAGYSTSDRSVLNTEGVIKVASSDLNGDGYTDLVFASHYGTSYASTSMIYWGSASGYDDADRTELQTYGAYDLEIADLDGDGWEELIFAQYYSGSSHVLNSYIYWGSASGYSTADLTGLYTTGAVDVEVLDLNGDGWLDLAFACYYSGSSYGTYSYVYWGSSTGPDSTNYDALYTYGAWDIDAGDLDGDGYTDLVFASYYSGSSYTTTSYIYWGNSGGYSAGDRTGLTTYGARGVVAEDLDLDGWDELFFAQYYSGSTYSFSSYLYQGTSSGYSSSDLTGIATEGAFRAQAADVDQDGWPDLVINSYYDGSFSLDSFVYYGSASGFSSTDRDDLPVDGPWGHAVVVGL